MIDHLGVRLSYGKIEQIMEKMDNSGISFCLTDTSGQTDQKSTGITRQQEEVININDY